MLNLSTKDEISLKDEIDFLKLYVEVENFRWNNKIQFTIEKDENVDIHRIKIPPMLIQPIIENAFVHAFDQYSLQPTINLKLALQQNFIEITVEDNGKGILNQEKGNKNYESKALKIINERLQLLNHNLDENIFISFQEKGTRVRLILKII